MKLIGKVKSYLGLKKAVSEVLIAGQREIEALKVRVYWETGRLIEEYLLVHPDEAVHGQGVVERLAEDLNLGTNRLYRMLRFSRSFPNFATWQNLTWSHFRELLSVTDDKKRKALAAEALEGSWPVRRLQKEIRKQKRPRAGESAGKLLETLIEPARGTHGVSKIGWLKKMGGRKQKVVSMGFDFYRELSSGEQKRFEISDLVRWSAEKKKWLNAGREEDVYFYRAEVERVVDGDTLLVHVDLGFKTKRRQYLRFRGLNAPEMKTSRGARAYRFLLKVLTENPVIDFKSRFTDRYDRYLSDVWTTPTSAKKKILYLNQELLTRGLAKSVNY